MKRASERAARTTAPFVEPTSVTVPLDASSTSATDAASRATGAATTTSSTSPTASPTEPAASTAPRSTAPASASSSGSNPRTSSTPARRAARATDAPIRPVPTTASERTGISTCGLAHELDEREHPAREHGEVTGGDLLRPVRERLLGIEVHFHDHAVGARGDGGERQRQHEVPTTRRVRRVDDDGKVRLLLQHRHGGDVERVSRRGLEGLDPALAEHHLVVALAHDVLGGHQELLDRGRRRALEEHRLLCAAHLGEE